MSDAGLSIASSALLAQQSMLDTIAQNVANVDTPSYRDQQVQLRALAGPPAGGGVTVAGVSQAGSSLLIAAARAAQGGAARQQAASAVLTGVVAAFPEPSTTGLGAQLATFWSAWDGVANSATQSAPRAQVLTLAGNLATSLHAAAAAVQAAGSQAEAQLSSVAGEVNNALAQIGTLNVAVVGAQAAGQPTAALVDQRAALLDQTAKDLGATVAHNSDGSVDVLVGGVRLVQGATVVPVSLTPGTGAGTPPGPTPPTLSAGGVALPVTAGTAAGLLSTLTTNLPGYTAGLNTVAADLVSTVNGQLAKGYDLTGGSPGQPLFTATSGSEAATIQVSMTNPDLLAAASQAGAPADGSNAQAVANLADSTTGPDSAYRSLVGQVGTDTRSAGQQLAAQQALANSAQQQSGSVAGVHTDQEMIAMVSAQQGYQAAAKVVATVQTMVSSLLAAV